MPRNLEIKIKINSFKEFKLKLKKHRIVLKKILIQRDVYYSVKNGLLKLRTENGDNSLIYYKRDEKSRKRWSDYQVIKFESGNIEKLLAEFLSKEVVISKRREVYLYDNTRIHLDRVKELGSFIELETLVINGLKDAENRFNHLIKFLELNTVEQIRSSYRDLLLKKKK
jgi:predicted adenylyl cyclase CyaB